MKIRDLPHFTITRINSNSEDVELSGTLSTLEGVHNGRSWLLPTDYSIIGDLKIIDQETKTATFVAPNFSLPQIHSGDAFPWLDGYWQAYFVRNIANKNWKWNRIEFAASDAIQFTQGERCGWTKIGNALPADSNYTGIIQNGWDHEHCEICWDKIGASGNTCGYVDSDNCWLCESCYQKHASINDVSFTKIK